MAESLLLIGAKLSAEGVNDFVTNIVSNATANNEHCTPICIWGVHGIGKTALVQEITRRNKWKFAYVAPAQFEEMGDLHGLPVIQGDTTQFAPPEWVPKEPGPGILLLDDFNRADDRIIRGLMQLLQHSEMISWSLPDDWHIVITANPEGGDYSVTPLDDAILTRMLHVSMEFDVNGWARWAIDQGIDERGVSFVLTYPEVVGRSRTTPRSLTQLFEQIKPIEDLRAEWEIVKAFALSALDEETATAFMAFVNDGIQELVTPDDILNGTWSKVSKRIDKLATDENGLRLDRLNAMTTRLYIEVTSNDFEPDKKQGKNIIAFLKHDSLPNDLRLMLHGDLVSNASPALIKVLRDKELAELALSAM